MELENIINLTSAVDMAKNGWYVDEQSINTEFDKYISDVNKYRGLVIEAWNTNQSCKHLEFNTPYYYIRRTISGDYVTHWNKVCINCGKLYHETTVGKLCPSGYEGATEKFYNNSI